MARLLLGAMPATGHVTPMLPLAATLVERGHEVRFYTGAAFRDAVERTGATYEPMHTPMDPGDDPLDEHLPGIRGKTGLKALRFALKHYFIDSSVGQLDDLRAILKAWPADLIVAEASFVGGGMLHELGEAPPWVAVNILPVTLSSKDTAPFGPGLPPMAGALGRARNTVLKLLVEKVVFGDVVRYRNRALRSVGLPPRRELIFDSVLSPYLYLQASVSSLEYPRSDLAPQVHFVGPMHRPGKSTEDLPGWWPEVVGSKRPVVHVTQGTVTTDPRQLLIPTLRALAEDDVLVVATTGGPDVRTLGPLPANARVAPFIPHAQLLPRTAVMVTNGGFGAVQVALSHGVPLVVAGATEDKPEVAARVAYTGSGVNLRTNTPTEAAIRDAVRRVLGDNAFPAAARVIAADMADHDGPVDASVLIERLLATGEPVLRGER